jgi:ribulose bisphosphate carboxylase small subunit
VKVDDIQICEPITLLIRVLIDHGFKIIEEKVSDYHFHELYIKMEGKYFNDIENLNINKITRQRMNLISCSCHWSIVELDFID